MPRYGGELVYVDTIGWIKAQRTTNRLEIFKSTPRQTLVLCTRQVCGVACVVRDGYEKNPIYSRKEIQGWWLSTIKDDAAGHQFALRNKCKNGVRQKGSVVLAHRATGLLISQPDTNGSLLAYYGVIIRQYLKLDLSLVDFCLLRLLQRMQKVHQQMRETTSLESAESVRQLGLDPQQTVEQWMGSEAYERAGSALVKLKLTT